MPANNNKGKSTRKKIRYAVVGLGYYAQKAALPAFARAKNSQLVALVSGDDEKIDELAREYNVDMTYHYDNFEDCLRSGEVDAVYIALPNHMHREYTVRAARAGVHVLCEKPMAVTEEECEEMIREAQGNNIKLMIAYRLHLEEANLKAVDVVQSGEIGDVRLFNSVFCMHVKDSNIRLNSHDMGGGTIYDIGVYCINASRYLFRDEPFEAFAYSANNGEERFRQTDEMTGVVLRYPGERLATFICSFGTSDVSSYQIVGTKGDLKVDPAYSSSGDLKHQLTVDGQTQKKTFKNRDQFAAELVYFSDCILQDKDPEPSGHEGLIDVHIIRSIYESAATGKPVTISKIEKRERPDMKQEIQMPEPDKVELVHAEPPSGEE